jgi:hypothetical protein
MSRAGVSVLGRDLVEVCVDETVNELGDRSDDPSYDELLAVLEPVTEKWGPRIGAVMLAATVDGDFPARAVCERVLDEDPRFALDALGPVQVDEARPTVVPAPKETPEERAAKQEQRRQRKSNDASLDESFKVIVVCVIDKNAGKLHQIGLSARQGLDVLKRAIAAAKYRKRRY